LDGPGRNSCSSRISAGVVDVAPNPLKPGVRFRRIGGHSHPGVDWCEIS
jgi:hypothetical protein